MTAIDSTLSQTATRDEVLSVNPWATPEHGPGLVAIAIAPAARKLPRAVTLPLPSLGGTSRAEFWNARGVVQGEADAEAEIWHSADVLFGRVVLDEAGRSLEELAEAGYRRIHDSNARLGFPHLLRVWNYLGAINSGSGDDERYRRFCVGRARAIPSEPATGYAAATAIGIPGAPSALHLHWLAARHPGVPMENPRQVSAWEYPRDYGPAAPGFSRAMLLEWPAAPLLLVSGTASVIGHASMHGGVLAQLAETLTNLDTLVARAGERVGCDGQLGAQSLMRVYVRHASDGPRVLRRLLERFGNKVPFLMLQGDICRRELLLEIEAVHRFR